MKLNYYFKYNWLVATIETFLQGKSQGHDKHSQER
jgi:hypothetical protein